MVARALHGLQFGLLRAEAVPHGSSSGTLGRSTAPHCCFFLVVCRLLSSPGFLCFGFLSPPLALLRRCDIYKKRRGRGRRPVPRSRAIAEAYALWKTFNLSMGWCCCCRRGGKAISSSTRARDGAGGVSTLNTLDILFRLIKRTPCRSREGKEGRTCVYFGVGGQMPFGNLRVSLLFLSLCYRSYRIISGGFRGNLSRL